MLWWCFVILVLHRKPVSQSRKIRIICSQPGKISKIEVENFGVNNIQVKKPIVNKRTGRITTYNYRDWTLITTVKDKEGRTFDNTSSLLFRYKFSNDDLAKVGKPLLHPYTLHPAATKVKVPLKGRKKKWKVYIENPNVCHNVFRKC